MQRENIYIGETGRILKYRFADHRGYVNINVTSEATGQHFNLQGLSLANKNIMLLEQVTKETHNTGRKEIDTLFKNGMNQKV